MKPFPFADDPNARKITVKYIGQSGNAALFPSRPYPDLFFRQNVRPIPGWLVMDNGPEFAVPQASMLIPSSVISGVDIADPDPEDICWQCLMARSWHQTIPASVDAGGHRFDWSPVGKKRREMYEAHPELFPHQQPAEPSSEQPTTDYPLVDGENS